MAGSFKLVIASFGFLVCVGGGCKGKDAAEGKGGGAGGKAAGRFAACDMPKAGNCREYREANLVVGTDSLKSLCDAVGGAFTLTACPAEGRTGVCFKNEGSDVFYAAYPISMSDAAASCSSSGGRWEKP